MCARCPRACGLSCRQAGVSTRWAPTALAVATRVRPCARTFRSMHQASKRRRFTPSPLWGEGWGEGLRAPISFISGGLVWPGLAPAGDLLFFASPQKRRQKKGEPKSGPLRGSLRCSPRPHGKGGRDRTTPPASGPFSFPRWGNASNRQPELLRPVGHGRAADPEVARSGREVAAAAADGLAQQRQFGLLQRTALRSALRRARSLVRRG